MPEITVIITTYNLERYIEACLEELRTQTFQNFEVLIVDDCSTDRTAELIRSCTAQYPVPIQFISTPENQGAPGKVRNFALDSGLIHGKYLIFLDGDDRLELQLLEKLHSLAVETEAEVTLCAYDRFEDETGHILCREMQGFPKEILLPPENDIIAFINGSLWNKLILTDMIGTLRIPDFKVGEDISFQLALFDRCHKITCVDQILIHYRVRTASVISSIQEDTIYRFADEIVCLRNQTAHLWMKENLAEIALIHIGISMPLRAYHNPQIAMKPLLNWISDYFAQNFHWFQDNQWMKFFRLKKHGVKGLGLWGAKVCHKLHCFSVFLWCYTFITRIFHIDIKF